MKPFIPIVELHFSNRCTGNCVICSKAHGYDSFPYLTPVVFNRIVANLQRIDFNVIQLGGDGDSFLNPYFLDFVQELRVRFSGKRLTLFTNGFALTPERSNMIIQRNLLDQIETRIDTVDPILFGQSTGLDFNVVSENLIYFMQNTTGVKNFVVYFPLFLYRDCVNEILNKEPTHFSGIEEQRLKNEYVDVWRFFAPHGRRPLFTYRNSEICLWGEREDVTPRVAPCSQVDRAFKNQVYIYPNGNIGLCPYDDGQNFFVLGNILTSNIDEVWLSNERQSVIESIANGIYAGGCYPCIDPLACDSYDWYKKKVGRYELY